MYQNYNYPYRINNRVSNSQDRIAGGFLGAKLKKGTHIIKIKATIFSTT